MAHKKDYSHFLQTEINNLLRMFRYYNTWQLDNDNVMQGGSYPVIVISAPQMQIVSVGFTAGLLTRYLTALHLRYICSGVDMI